MFSYSAWHETGATGMFWTKRPNVEGGEKGAEIIQMALLLAGYYAKVLLHTSPQIRNTPMAFPYFPRKRKRQNYFSFVCGVGKGERWGAQKIGKTTIIDGGGGGRAATCRREK